MYTFANFHISIEQIRPLVTFYRHEFSLKVCTVVRDNIRVGVLLRSSDNVELILCVICYNCPAVSRISMIEGNLCHKIPARSLRSRQTCNVAHYTVIVIWLLIKWSLAHIIGNSYLFFRSAVAIEKLFFYYIYVLKFAQRAILNSTA